MPVQAMGGGEPTDDSSGVQTPSIGGLRSRAGRMKQRAARARRAASAKRTDLREEADFAVFQGQILRAGIEQKAPYLEQTEDDGLVKAAISGTFNMVVAAAVTLIVGIYVFSQISSTMPTPQNSDLANATDTVKSTTGNAFTLGAVAVIVLVAALILSLIGSGFGGGGSNMGR